ncbi:MAG: hypothetical protein Q9160_000483 [Pyrenula sp. 1 TL-2023]
MVMNDGLLRIFWPNDLSQTGGPGVLVGWKNSDLDFFVVTVLPDIEPRNVESAFRTGTLYRNTEHPIAQLFNMCGKPSMHVLGTVNHPSLSNEFDPSCIRAYTLPSVNFPHIFCPRENGISVQVVLFERPHPRNMQYISLQPIPLALGDKHVSTQSFGDPFDAVNAEEALEEARTAKLVDKLKLHSIVHHASSRKETLLPAILNQINCSWELGAILHRNISLIGYRRKRDMSVSERVVESATTLWTQLDIYARQLWLRYTYPLLSRAFIAALITHRILAEGILYLLEYRPPLSWIPRRGSFAGASTLNTSVELLALKEVSATSQQLDIRLQQFCYWPLQYLTLRSSRQTWMSIPTSHSNYIRFYNSLWLVANDVIIGIALGSYIIENTQTVAERMSVLLHTLTVTGFASMIKWLMSYPAGLKLNTELALFLGDLFLWVIDYWSLLLATFVIPALPSLINLIGFSSFAGASFPIALCSDLLSLLTLHIYCFYIASARIFNWQLSIISSLFQLFRGKKWNVLRNRIDSCDYDLDQLLLGTILFTLLFFLLPTVAVFYMTFAGARIGIIVLKAALDSCLACLNHFPLFALMLRVKDSKRLPGGVRFQLDLADECIPLQSDSPKPVSNTSYIFLSSAPLSLTSIFAQYFQLADRIRKHYFSPSVLLCLAKGKFIPGMDRRLMYSLQYSMLPSRRAGIGDLWRALGRGRY